MVTRPVAEGALATAAVEIIAELERFEPDLRAKLIAAAQRVGRDVEKEFDRQGARAGKSFSDAAGKVSSSSSAFDDVAASTERLSKAAKKAGDDLSKSMKQPLTDVQRLEAAVRKAADAQADSAGRIRIAEQQLAEIRADSNAKLSSVIAAEERLATARRKGDNDLGRLIDLNRRLAGSQDESARSSGRFAAAFSKIAAPFQKVGSLLANTRLGQQVGKDFAKIGEAAGGGFLSGLQGVVSTPVVGPIILATLLAVAEAVAAPIGAVLAGGVVSAFGAGIAALGIVFAAQSDVVKARWKSTLQQMAAQLRVLSVPFQTTLDTIAHQASSTFAQLAPSLRQSFAGLAPVISNFSGQFAQAIGRLGPTIAHLSSSFGTVLQSLGPALSGMIAEIAAGLDRLASSVAKNPTALADFVTGIGQLVTLVLDMIRVFNDANGAVERLTGGFSLVDALFQGIAVAAGLVLGPLALLAKGIAIVADGLNALKGGESGKGLSEAAQQLGELAKGMQQTGGAAAPAIAGLAGTGAAAETAATKFARQKAATDALVQSMFRLQNLALGLSGAQINFQSAIDQATASIKENGRTLDINTEKGRANQSALNQVAQSANAQTQALIESNAGLGAAAASANNSRASFIRLATQMGLSKAAAKAMAIELIGIPNVSREARLTANKKDLETKLAAAKRELADPNLTKERRAQLTATIKQLQAQVRAANAALASVKDKSVSVTVNYRQLLGPVVPRQDVGVRLPGKEHGGPVTKGQPYIVGEKRPEVFVPDQSGVILPRVPAALAAAGAFGAGLTAALLGAGGDAVAGLIDGLSSGVPAVAAASAAVAGAVIGTVRSRLDMHSPSRVMEQAGKDAVQGLINGIREKLPNLQAVLVALSKAVPSQVASAVNKVNSALGGLGKALTTGQRTKLNQFIADARTGIASLDKAGAQVEAKLKAASQRLSDLRQQAQQFATSVATSILQTGNIAQGGDDTSFAGIVKRLQEAVTNARAFQSVLARLSKAGLNKTALQQIAEAGPAQGAAIGESILKAGAAGVATVNRLQGQLQTAANKAATTAANALFSQGIKVAQGVVAGLQQQKAKLDLAMTRLGDVLVARVLQLLRSSKIVKAAGTISIPGFSNGGLATSLSAVAEDGRPELVIPMTKPKRRDQLLEQYFGGWAEQRAWNGGGGYGGKVREINMPMHIHGLSADQVGDVVEQRLSSRGLPIVRGIDTSRGRL